MQLQEFIGDALSQIIAGVTDAQKHVAKSMSGGEIAPSIQTDWEKTGYVFTAAGQPIQKVDFDIAVTVNQTTGSKGTIGIVVASIGIGSQRESGKAQTNESRIKFSVPVALPAMVPSPGST